MPRTTIESSSARARRSGLLNGTHLGPPGEHDSALLAALLQSSQDAILSLSLNGTIAAWNTGAERIFGYTAPEIVGKPESALFPPDHMHEWPSRLDRLKQGTRAGSTETVRV